MSERLCRFDRLLMGGVLTISLHGEDQVLCRSAADAAFREVERLERALTLFNPDSDLCRVNRDAGRHPAPIDSGLEDLIVESIRWSRRTRGAFDITVGPLMRLWGFRGGRTRPSRDDIARTLERVGYENLVHDPNGSTIFFSREGIEIDPGGIGKGYAVDRTIKILRAAGVERALVSFGSVSCALGSPPGAGGWLIGIQDPHDPDRTFCTLRLRNRAVASAGDTHQTIKFGDEVLPHVIDPRCGHPVTEVRGTTVVHPSATCADALSTALMVLGKDEGLSFLAREPGLEGLLVVIGRGGAGDYYTSTGWADLLESPYRGMTRRRFVRTALLAFGSLLVIGGPVAGSIESRAKGAVRALYPHAVSIRQKKIRLDGGQMHIAQEAAGKRFRNDTYVFCEIIGGDGEIGYGVILDVPGKERPITFLVVVDPEGAVAGVEVLAYREAIGGEIRSERFLDRFRRKTLESPLRPGEDVPIITGATISSRSTGYAVRKGLALVHAVYGTQGGGAGR